MIAASDVTGQLLVERRTALKLSRAAFAQLVELTPGALWRLEVKNKFKPGEAEHLAAVADRWLAGAPVPVQSPAQPPEPPAPVVSPPAVDGAPVDELGDPVQWLDPPRGEGLVVAFDTTNVLSAAVVVPLTPLTEQSHVPTQALTPTQLTEQDGVLRVSNSEAQSHKDCPRRWWLSYYRGLRPKVESPVGPRAVGVRGHAALRAQYVGPDEVATDARDALERLIVEDWTRLVAHHGEYGVPPDLAKRFTQDADLERIILDGYAEWVAETGADGDLELIGSERYLEADLSETAELDFPLKIVGRLDVRARRKTDGLRLFVDHKFVGSIVRPLLTLTMDEQMLWYMLLEQLQSDEQEPVAGALYNMLRRVKRTPSATPPFYQRVEVHHNKHELSSFLRRTGTTVRRLHVARARLDAAAEAGIADAHLSIVPPRPTQDCSWKCPFVRVCPMFDDGSRVEAALQEHFVAGDPYSYYDSQEVITTC